jgi:hypothetical protein
MALHDVESNDDEAENLWGQAPEANAAGRKSCRCRRARSDEFVREIQMRLSAKKWLQKKFLSEILKEVRSEGRCVSNLQAAVRTPPFEGEKHWEGELFTLYQLVEPMGVEPTTS